MILPCINCHSERNEESETYHSERSEESAGYSRIIPSEARNPLWSIRPKQILPRYARQDDAFVPKRASAAPRALGQMRHLIATILS